MGQLERPLGFSREIADIGNSIGQPRSDIPRVQRLAAALVLYCQDDEGT
jgi:hypothetical protein